MAHTWTKIGELEEFSAGGLIKADDFNEIHEEIRDSVNDFVDEVDEVVEDLEATDTALGGRLTTAEGTITSHGTRLTTAEGTLTTHGSTLTSHGSTLTNHGSRLTTAESDIDTLETSVESTQEDVEDLEDAVDTVEARVDAVEDDIETLETLIAANTTAITNEATRAGGVEAGLNTRLGTAESTITSHTSTLTGHTNTLGQHTNSINNHNNRLSVAEGNISTLNTNKQNKLTAGTNVTISNNVISAIDTNSVFEMDSDTPIADIQAAQAEGKIIMLVSSGGSTYLLTFENTQYYYFTTFHSGGTAGVRVYTAQLKKSDHTWTSSSFMLQNELTAGTGITISNNVISATSGATELFWCTYGETTAQEIQNALDVGKIPAVKNANKIYTWQYATSTYHYFLSTQVTSSLIRHNWTLVNITNSNWQSGARDAEQAGYKKNTMTGYQTSDTYYPTTKAVYDFAQPRLTAGTGITISNDVISATGGESNLLIGKPPSDPSDPQPGELTYVQVAEAIQAGKLVIMIDPFVETDLYTYGGFWNYNHLFYYTWHDGTNTYTQRGLFNEDNEWTVGESNILMNENAANKAYSITSSEFDEDDAYPNLKAVKNYAEPKHQDFRLLNEITLNGEASITLTADADGVAYNFKEMVVLYNNVTPSDTTVQCNLQGYAYDQFDHVIGGMYFDSWKTNRYGRSYIKYEGGFYRTINQKTTGVGQWNSALTSESSTMWSVFNTTSRIRKINIASNTSGITMASGTIKIYGR